MRTLGPAAIGEKAKATKRETERFGRGEIPIPKPPDVQNLARFSPAVSSKQDLAERGPFSIQGMRASDLEWRTYKTLHRLGWTDRNIHFQTSILGGRRPGGQVLDFVLYGPGQVYVIAVNGDYWHAVGNKTNVTRFNEDIVHSVMPSAKFIALYSGDLLNDELAYNNLRVLVGRGW